MTQDISTPATEQLLSALKEIFESEAAKNTNASPILKRVLEELPNIHLDQGRGQADNFPVCEHLNATLDSGEAGSAASVARAIRILAPTLIWGQSANHSLETRGAYFMDNYAYSGLGLTGSDTLSIGVLLLGPDITYPVTAYPSEGVFLVVGGSPKWASGDDPWRQVSAGDIISRPKGAAEGKRPGEEPMLALYAWLS